MSMSRNNSGLSPVVAAIILVAVIVAISVAIASWIGALDNFDFMSLKPERDLTCVVPSYPATHCRWWIQSTYGSNESVTIIPFPCNASVHLTRLNRDVELQLIVSYYEEVAPNIFKSLETVNYVIVVMAP